MCRSANQTLMTRWLNLIYTFIVYKNLQGQTAAYMRTWTGMFEFAKTLSTEPYNSSSHPHAPYTEELCQPSACFLSMWQKFTTRCSPQVIPSSPWRAPPHCLNPNSLGGHMDSQIFLSMRSESSESQYWAVEIVDVMSTLLTIIQISVLLLQLVLQGSLPAVQALLQPAVRCWEGRRNYVKWQSQLFVQWYCIILSMPTYGYLMIWSRSRLNRLYINTIQRESRCKTHVMYLNILRIS